MSKHDEVRDPNLTCPIPQEAWERQKLRKRIRELEAEVGNAYERGRSEALDDLYAPLVAERDRLAAALGDALALCRANAADLRGLNEGRAAEIVLQAIAEIETRAALSAPEPAKGLSLEVQPLLMDEATAKVTMDLLATCTACARLREEWSATMVGPEPTCPDCAKPECATCGGVGMVEYDADHYLHPCLDCANRRKGLHDCPGAAHGEPKFTHTADGSKGVEFTPPPGYEDALVPTVKRDTLPPIETHPDAPKPCKCACHSIPGASHALACCRFHPAWAVDPAGGGAAEAPIMEERRLMNEEIGRASCRERVYAPV